MSFVKRLIKWLLILLLLLVGFIVLAFLLEKALTMLEEKFGKNEKDIVMSASDIFDNNKNNSNQGTNKDSNSENNSAGDSNGNDKSKDGNNSNNSTNKEIKYSPFNLDDVVLLYEGRKKGSSVKELLNRLVDNTEQTLYSYVTVTAFGNKIVFEDKDAYVSQLKNIINSVDDSSFYDISFGLNSTKTIVNEIIIEKASN